jgi:hypothetical protein
MQIEVLNNNGSQPTVQESQPTASQGLESQEKQVNLLLEASSNQRMSETSLINLMPDTP